jgi:hypothetical protein
LKVGETVKLSYVDQSRTGIDPNKNGLELFLIAFDIADAVAPTTKKVVCNHMEDVLAAVNALTPEEKKKLIIWISAAAMLAVLAVWALLLFGPGRRESAAGSKKDNILGSIGQSFSAMMKSIKK